MEKRTYQIPEAERVNYPDAILLELPVHQTFVDDEAANRVNIFDEEEDDDSEGRRQLWND